MLVPVTTTYLRVDKFKTVLPALPGSAGRPIPGGDVRIFDEISN